MAGRRQGPVGGGRKAGILVSAVALAAGCASDHGASPFSGSVVLNEIDCHGRDWVELVNVTSADIDIGGWTVADDFTKEGHQYAFASGTILAAGDHFVVLQQLDLEAGFPFGLACGRDTVFLADEAEAVVDEVKIGDVPEGSTFGRLPDAAGDFQETSPTSGGANQPPVSAAAVLFDPGSVNDIAIELPEDSVATLAVAPGNLTQATVRITVGDVVHEDVPVGIRLKVGDGFRPLGGKASFEIVADAFDPTSRLLGLAGLGLDAMVDDPSFQHQSLAYAIFRAAGLPAARTGYARVTVNGEPYGVYATIESIDAVFARLHFDSTLHVYRGGQDIGTDAVDAFDAVVGDPDDREDLRNLALTVQGFADADWMAGVSMRLDVDAFASLWAIENYVGQARGYAMAAKGYALHSTTTGRFTLLPSDLGGAFVETPALPSCTSLACTRCLAIPECAAKYDVALAAAATTVAGLDLDARITAVDAVLAPLVSGGAEEITAPEHEAAIEALRAWLPARAATVAAMGGATP